MIHTLEKMAEHKIMSFIRNLQEEAWCSLPIGPDAHSRVARW